MMSVETATSAAFLKAPVAKALALPLYTATSGVFTPALAASEATVSTSQRSAGPSEPSMVRAPHDIFAIVFDSSSEMHAPRKP